MNREIDHIDAILRAEWRQLRSRVEERLVPLLVQRAALAPAEEAPTRPKSRGSDRENQVLEALAAAPGQRLPTRTVDRILISSGLTPKGAYKLRRRLREAGTLIGEGEVYALADGVVIPERPAAPPRPAQPREPVGRAATAPAKAPAAAPAAPSPAEVEGIETEILALLDTEPLTGIELQMRLRVSGHPPAGIAAARTRLQEAGRVVVDESTGRWQRP